MDKRALYRIGGMGYPTAIFILLVLLVGIVETGCGGPSTYIHPSPGLDMVKKVAVMPFDNLSKDTNAGDKVRIGFVIELLKTGSFDVMDIGEADRLLRAAGLSYDIAQSPAPAIRISREQPAAETTEVEDAFTPLSKQIGETLKVQAILRGSVDTYSSERVRDESVPEVTVAARLIDVETGVIIWASTHTRRGSPGIPILGWGKSVSLGLVARKVVQDMANDLAQYVPWE